MRSLKINLKLTFQLMFILAVLSNLIMAQGITIKSGTTITGGSAAITLSGNWSNSGTFTAGTGTVLFNGASGNQTITNSSGETFNKLTVNKTSGDVQLINNLTVNGALTLTSGDVDLNGKTTTLGSSALLSETTGNTVKGTTGSITTTRSLNAPNSNNVAGMGAELTSSADLGSTIITRGHTAQTGNSNTGIARYFDITPTNNNGLNATLVFHYDDRELNGITESELELFRSTDSGINWTEEGGTVNTAENTVTLAGINSFSRWTLAGSTDPLPVELTSFSATVKETSVTLSWETKTEVKNYGFDIERKLADTTRKEHWAKMGFVEGAGNSNSPKYYSFIDKGPEGGTKFQYRLKQIDMDGEVTYSNILDVEIVVSSYELFQNFPNPFNPTTTIKYSIPADGLVTLKVYDVLGNEVITLVNEGKQAGFYNVELNSVLLASGVYFYSLQAGDFVEIKKMVLLK